MEISLLRLLLNNLCSLLQLSSLENKNSKLVHKYFQKTEDILKPLKPILNGIVDADIASDEHLQKEFSGLCNSVDELGKLFQTWQQFSSKVYSVLFAESLITKVQACCLKIVELLVSFYWCLPTELSLLSLESYMLKIKSMDYDPLSTTIKKAIKNHLEVEHTEDIAKIAENLSLNSNQELLIELVALEKLREKAEQSEKTEEVEHIEQIIALVTHMHESLVAMKQGERCAPVQIPSDFCCPLSLELMTDPVIVASGQTYERAFIRKWIDLGLRVCPKTRQPLTHTNLIPNYTVKALIANWCESNNIKLPRPMNSNQPVDLNSPRETSSSPSGATQREEKAPSNPNSPTHFSMPLTIMNSLSAADDDSSHQGHTRTISAPSSLSNSNFPPMDPKTSRRDSNFPSTWRRTSLPRIASSSSSSSRADLTEVTEQVRKLIEDLKSNSIDQQRDATAELRLLAKHNLDNRVVIANCGAIDFLVNLLRSEDMRVQENAVTALLNLSINDNNKSAIADALAIEPLIHVLENGTPEAKENSAATLFSLSVIEENKILIGRSGAITPLVELLGKGTPRGRKDAATALYNLSILHENKPRIVQAGAVKHLVELMDPATGMVDKAVAVLSNLSTIQEGRVSIGQEGGIPVLVEVVELGSARGKENAAAALLHLCTNSSRYCNMVLQHGAIPPLVALSSSGTPRAREKALALLSYFRSQRRGTAGRG